MNYGIFKNDKYIKKVTFSKAVLWHTRQLSLRSDIINRIKRDGVKKIVFQDDLKGERWIFSPAKVFKTMVAKQEGQEEQYYFPIDICTKEKFTPKPVLVFDETRQVYVEVGKEFKQVVPDKILPKPIVQTNLFDGGK